MTVTSEEFAVLEYITVEGEAFFGARSRQKDVVRSLEDKGLVVSEPNPKGGKWVQPTAAGNDLVESQA